MAGNFQMTINRDQFDRALAEYAKATRKDLADVANRQMMSLAIHGVQLTKQAEEGAIRKIESFDWWPKYVAKVLVGRAAGKVVRTAKAKGARAGRNALRRFMARAYTRAQARVASRKLIRKRLMSTRFLKFFFVTLAAAVKPFVKGGRAVSVGRKFRGFDMRVTPATPEKTWCGVLVRYPYRLRKSKTAQGAEALLNKTLSNAYAATTRDMLEYAAKKMRETAAKHSARRVA